jgi:hypothetical protein
MEHTKRRGAYAVNRYGYVIRKKMNLKLFLFLYRFDTFMSNINAVIGIYDKECLFLNLICYFRCIPRC